MPELPDVEAYRFALEKRIVGARLDDLKLGNPFILRSVIPTPEEVIGQQVTQIRRLGKRIVISLSGDQHIVIHLMIAGRLQWKVRALATQGRLPGKSRSKPAALALFEFSTGQLLLTEAGTRRLASLHLVASSADLAIHDPGGLEILSATVNEFEHELRSVNYTIKRALTDPRLFSGIGNAYSDEILHRAQLSPYARTQTMKPDVVARLFEACQLVLREATERLCAEAEAKFPDKVTAFRPEFAVHGKFGQPCPVCAQPIQRIVYADNEMNYCARCQTDDRLLSDRALAKLLKDDWPKTLSELLEQESAIRKPTK